MSTVTPATAHAPCCNSSATMVSSPRMAARWSGHWPVASTSFASPRASSSCRTLATSPSDTTLHSDAFSESCCVSA
eukprot:4379752-Prymnesium_polylepis.1